MKYSFSSLNLDDNLVSSLAKVGIVNPSPVQYNFIQSSIYETSIIFQSKSGTGKTISYCISLINKIIQRNNKEKDQNNIDSLNISQYKNYYESSYGDVVIIVPTRELSYQIYYFFLSLSPFIDIIKPILLVGSSDVLKVINYMKKNNVNVVISTPGRIKTILRSKPNKIDINKYGLKSNHLFFKTHLLIFDEADMLLDDHFFDQTKFICSKLCNPFVQVVAVSATFLKPQFKSFEDMIYEMDKIYINWFINNLDYRSDDIVKSGYRSNNVDDNITNNDNYSKSDINTNNTEENVNISGNEEQIFLETRLSYYINHLLLNKKIKNLDLLNKYIYSFKRRFLKIILSTSYLSRILDLKSLEFGKESYYITSETTQTIDTNYISVFESNNIVSNNINNNENINKDNDCNSNYKNNNNKHNNGHNNIYESITLVLDKVDFYNATVRDAPNIVMQIGLKIEVVVKVLSNIRYNKCIIFCNQSHTRIQTYKLLQSLGYSCYINSSRVSPSERVKTLFDLNSIDKVVILCTDLMSRGIGFSNVDLVINMDIPSSKEVFLHRSGRSGRFGSTGICVTICMESEIDTYEYFLYSLNFKSLPIENIYSNNFNNNIDSGSNIIANHLDINNDNVRNNDNYSKSDINSEFDLSSILERSVRPKKISEINVDVYSLVEHEDVKSEDIFEELNGLNHIENNDIENMGNNTNTKEKDNKLKQRNREKRDVLNDLITDIDFEIDINELIKGFMKQRISFCESVET